MNFLTAQVEVKVDDSKLPSQLAKAKSAVTRTVDKIKTSFRKMGSAFKAVFSKMVHYAKWGALAIAGAFVLVTRAAMKQQDAVFLLMSALKISGEYTEQLEQRFKAFASSIQQATIYGDEEVLALMQLQKSLGVTSDKLEIAAKQAIGLATATGRDVKSMAMYIALAQQGEFTMLRRYIPALRSTTDETEQLRIITEVCAQGFELAEERAKTASGGLKQMWNALGDIAERIGGAFLPAIQDSARAIKEWAERNQDKIGRWSETAAAYVNYVKDVLWMFAKFLKSDWKAGVKIGLDVTLELFKGFGEALLVLIVEVASRAADIFTEVLGTKMAKGIAGVIQKIDMAVMGAGYEEWAQKKGAIRPEHFKVTAPKTDSGVGEKLKQIAGETTKRIKDIIPPELEAGFEEPLTTLRASLAEIGTVAEEIQEPLEKALVQTPEKSTIAVDKATSKLKDWVNNAKDIYGNLADVAVNSFNSTADALTNLCLTGKADFNSLAQSILQDLTRLMIKAQMAQMFQSFMPGLFGGAAAAGAGASPIGIPGLQHGGEVKKTGLAVVHKGETFSGVDPKPTQGATLNINVNAIDAAGTYQFLSKNKRAIATMMQGMMTSSNHPIRRSS